MAIQLLSHSATVTGLPRFLMVTSHARRLALALVVAPTLGVHVSVHDPVPRRRR